MQISPISRPAAILPGVVAFVLLPKFTMLAFSSAIEPLRMANQLTQQVLFRWTVLSDDGGPVACSNGVPVMVDGPWNAAKPEGIILVVSGVEPEGKASVALGDWLRGLWRRGRMVGGLCTGAYALAQAGILKGRRFTMHWDNTTAFSENFPDLEPSRIVLGGQEPKRSAGSQPKAARRASAARQCPPSLLTTTVSRLR